MRTDFTVQQSECVRGKTMMEDKDQLAPATGQSDIREITEDEIDRNLMGTFPASDPPSWTLGVERDRKPASEAGCIKALSPRK